MGSTTAAAGGDLDGALRLDPDSVDVLREAGRLQFHAATLRRSARPYWERYATWSRPDIAVGGLLITCYTALGDTAERRNEWPSARWPARRRRLQPMPTTVLRWRRCSVVCSTSAKPIGPRNGPARRADRPGQSRSCATTWRAISSSRFTITTWRSTCCAPSAVTPATSRWRGSSSDPDMDPLRDDPRFKEMVAAGGSDAWRRCNPDVRPERRCNCCRSRESHVASSRNQPCDCSWRKTTP